VKVSLVVRARNEAVYLPRLIEGISAQDYEPDECLLVDSGSTDETREIAASAGWKVIQMPAEDFTFGRSLNLGCKAASGDVLVILSAHVYPVRADYLRKMVEAVAERADTVAYGRQIGDQRTKFSERVIMSQWFPSERIADQGHAFTNNANAAISKELWARFKYDEDLSGLEDIELTARVLAEGGRVTYVNEAPVVHVHEESFSSIRERYRREASAYKQIFAGEGMTLWHAVSLFLKNSFRDSRLAQEQSMFSTEFCSIISFRLAQFWGAWNGFRVRGAQESDLQIRMYHPQGRSFPVEESAPLTIVYRAENA
jgi:glycosyltransferase involved in cell wall biosynthesis